MEVQAAKAANGRWSRRAPSIGKPPTQVTTTGTPTTAPGWEEKAKEPGRAPGSARTEAPLQRRWRSTDLARRRFRVRNRGLPRSGEEAVDGRRFHRDGLARRLPRSGERGAPTRLENSPGCRTGLWERGYSPPTGAEHRRWRCGASP